MAFDGMLTYVITEELKEAFTASKVLKIYQPYGRELIFHMRTRQGKQRLLLSANPTYPRIHITEAAYENPMEAPMFCMLLRKHLEGGVIESITQQDTDRVIYFDIRSRDELGDESIKRLIIEIMGRHSNILLVDPDRQVILDSIHHVPQGLNQHRVLLPGRPYIEPPKQDKVNPLSCGQETFINKLGFNEGQLDKQLVQQFKGLSPLLAKEIMHLAELPTKAHVQEAFFKVIGQIKSLQIQPAIMKTESKEIFYLFPLSHVKGDVTLFQSTSDMLETFYHGKAERDRVKQKAHDFAKFLSNELEKNKKKLSKLHNDLKTAENADQYQLFGELLTAYMHQLERGADKAELYNYYEETPTLVSIPLDPSLSPNENAQRFFKRYQKAKGAVQFIQDQIEKTKHEISYFESLLQQMEQASPKDIEEMREELVEEGYIRQRQKHKQKKKNETPKYERFKASDGTEIVVGKNNKQNEYVTMRLARASDTWLHTKEIPGSHVIIRSPEVSQQTLLEAAQIAGFYSKARHSSRVPVDYTLIKHVRKPSGAKPGFVICEQQKTLYVTPSEAVVAQLKASNPA